jgi:hypothetical protein
MPFLSFFPPFISFFDAPNCFGSSTHGFHLALFVYDKKLDDGDGNRRLAT